MGRHRIELVDGSIRQQEVGILVLDIDPSFSRLKKHRAVVSRHFGMCSSKADTVPKHAKCIVDLLEHKNGGFARRSVTFKCFLLTSNFKLKNRMDRYGIRPSQQIGEWTGGFRIEHRRPKRHIARSGYNLHSTVNRMTPLGSVARLLMESILAKKNKTEAPR